VIRSPVLIIGCPRSGTTLLYNLLSEVPSLWSIGHESKGIIERYHHPRTKGWESGALDASDLTPESRAYILQAFERAAAPGTFWQGVNRFRRRLRSHPLWQGLKQRGRSTAPGSAVSSALPSQGIRVLGVLARGRNWCQPSPATIRLLEKTPENCLRLPFLLALWPDARILYLTREAPSNVNSLLEGWRQPHLFPGYQVPEALHIPGYRRDRWAFTLIPGWRALVSSPLEEVCAWQWIRCNEAVLAHQEGSQGLVPYLRVRYEALVADPGPVLRRIADFIDVDFDTGVLAAQAEALPRINVVSAPDRDKWRRQNREAIERILPLVEPTMQRLGYRPNA
jgi:LPS sulfotransferase NodH